MGLSRAVSETDDDFHLKSTFPHPFVFCAPAERVPLSIGYRRRGSQN